MNARNIHNSIALIGVLPEAPVYITTENGADLTRFKIATPDRSGDRTTTVIHQCFAWGPAALSLHSYLSRGSQLAIQGELKYRRVALSGGDWGNLAEVSVIDFTFLD